MQVDKLAIVFNDNDFHNEFRLFLKLIIEETDTDNLKFVTKEQIVNMFNKVASRLYFLYMRHLDEDVEHMDNYLKISERNVLLNEEVDLLFTSRKYDFDIMEIVYFDWINDKHYVYNRF